MKFPTKSHLTSLGLLVNSPKRVALVQVWQGLVARAGGGSAVARSNCAWIMDVLNGALEPVHRSSNLGRWKIRISKGKSCRNFGIFTEFSRKPCLMTPESSSIFHGKIVWTCLFLRVNLAFFHAWGGYSDIFWKGIIQGDFLIFMGTQATKESWTNTEFVFQCQVSLSRGYTSKKYPQHVRYTPQVLHYIHFHMVFQGCLRVSLGFM